jgi:hypothetical protein
MEPGSLANGAIIYSFSRLPLRHEYEYELSADHPGGLRYTFLSDKRYPPGSSKIQEN